MANYMKLLSSDTRRVLAAAILVAMQGALNVPLQAADDSPQFPSHLRTALESITGRDLLLRIKLLASDEFEGRAPGSWGEELSVNYISEQFKFFGLQPGNPDGTYIQKVPLVGFTSRPVISYRAGGRKTDLSFPGDCVAWSRRYVPEVKVEDSDLVFVGYGIVAPEYGWDDYKNVDVRGKTLVMLINDPPRPDPLDPSKLDEKMFKGRAMTYYGRWTYKYEIATEKGAAAAIIVHETGPAGYPYSVVTSSNSRENFDLDTPDKNSGRVAVEGWITYEAAKRLLSATGHDFDGLKQSALSREFKPVPLGSKATFQVKNTLRQVTSRNVIAKLEGSDPKLKDECVIYTAHWDHLGRDPGLKGDQIFNGAIDNASGTAGLLELAQAFTQLQPAPKRTMLFLAVTAEEKGLLGAKYYAAHPFFPLTRTLANLNMDVINVWGRTSDINIIGYGNTTLEDLLTEAARTQRRVTTADSEPEKGRFYRSDHFEFAKLGVPALYFKAGIDYIDKLAGYGPRKNQEYTELDYHKVTDEVKLDWDLLGAIQDLQLLFQVGYEVAQGDKYPEWKPGTEFKARREQMLQREAKK
jgi:Zn-dependent M28 family amino/carboxypeptidase